MPRRCRARCASAGPSWSSRPMARSARRSATTVPAAASDADRDALALLGEVAPTLLPMTRRPPLTDPIRATMGARAGAPIAAPRGYDATREFADGDRRVPPGRRRRPGDANAWYRLGLAAARLGRVDEALGGLRRRSAPLRPGRRRAALAAARRARSRPGCSTRPRPADGRARDAGAGGAGRRPGGGARSARRRRRRPQASRRGAGRGGAGRAGAADRAVCRPSSTGGCCTTRTSASRRSPAFDAVVAALDGRRAPFDGLHWYARRLPGATRPPSRGPRGLRARDRRSALRSARLHQPGDAAATPPTATTTPWPRWSGWCGPCRRRRHTPRRCGCRRCSATVIGPLQLRTEARERFAGEPALRLLPR